MLRVAQRLALPLAVVLTLAWGVVLVQELTGLGRMRSLPMDGARRFEERENRWLWRVPRRYATHLTELTGYVTEDGRPLFRTSSHREVRQHGAGRFRVHGRSVSFAAWDDSDPNTNGRRYVFHAPRPLKPWLVWGGLVLVVGAHGWARYSRGGHPPPQRLLRHGWFASKPSMFTVFLGLLGAALAARSAWLLAHPDPNDGFMMVRGLPYSDAAQWVDMARSMAHGHGLSGPSDGQRPLYPIVLAPWLALGLNAVTAAQWVNVVVGAASAAVLGVIAWRLAGFLAALAATAFLSLAGMQIRMLHLPMSETVGLGLLVVALGLLWRGGQNKHVRDLFLGGLFLGLSNLVCPFTILALPLAGVMAAIGRGGFWKFLGRGAWVAAGASLVIVPWLIRQHRVHGMAAISTNGPLLLYATASPSGRYDAAIGDPVHLAGVAGNPDLEAQEYARLFREAVRRDPALYGRRVRDGFTAWWLKFDPRHPSLLLILVLAGTSQALVFWWRGGGPGALASAGVVLPLMLALSRVDGGGWAALATAGALATMDRRVWRFAALAFSVVLGCAAMNALTSGALANRLWVMGDWLIVTLALVAVHHAIAHAARWRARPLSSFAVNSPPDDHSAHSLPGLNPTAWVHGCCVMGSSALVALMALRGPVPPSTIPDVSDAAQQAACASTVERLGLADSIPADSPLVWCAPVRLSPHRALLPARLAVGHWSRAFHPRRQTRTVIPAATPHRRSATLQVPGEVHDPRELPNGPWLAVGIVNRDPQAFLGAEVEMIEVLALWPLDLAGNAGPADSARFFPPPAAIRSLIPPPLRHGP